MPSSTIVLVATLFIEPDLADKYLEVLRPAYEAVIAEPELLSFEIGRDPDEPGVFKIIETWNASKDWLLNVQLQKEYYKPYVEAVGPMFAQPIDVQIYERIPGWGIKK